MTIFVKDDSEVIADPTAEIIARVDTRFSIVRDAVLKQKSHRDEAIGQFFDAIYAAFGEFRITGSDSEPLDVRVLRVLQRMKPLRDFFLDFVDFASKSDSSSQAHDAIRPFLGKLLEYKHPPRDVVHFNHLWCDHYRFALRELFIEIIASLIANRDYAEVNRYLEAEYLFDSDRGPQRACFLRFDSYVRSIDEFRTRRLRQRRLSAAADLLMERADRRDVSFTDIMQADFLLCIRGLLHYPKAMTRWFPRTLVHAHEFEKKGFDLFFAAQSKKNFLPIKLMLGVGNKSDLVQRFEQVSNQCSLAEWKFGGVPIPFERYMGLVALASA